MSRLLISCFLFLLCPSLGLSQSLSISVEEATARNEPSTFQLAENNVSFSNNAIAFLASGARFNGFMAYGVSPDHAAVGILKNRVEGAESFIMNTTGDTLTSYPTISLSYDDPSLGIYPSASGSALIRNNIANFTLYDSFGSIVTSASGGSRSEEGESISEVAMDDHHKTILIYTPKIRKNGTFGSQAGILQPDNSLKNIFFSSDRSISYGDVSENGQFVLLVTSGENSNHEAIIMDRYGNTINRISSDEELNGAALTDDGRYVLLTSGRRALVYSVLGGTRMGSTSFRSTLIRAEYFPEDDLILAVTGDYSESSGFARDVEFHAVNLEKRKLEREELRGALGLDPKIKINIERERAGRYRMTGASHTIRIQARF